MYSLCLQILSVVCIHMYIFIEFSYSVLLLFHTAFIVEDLQQVTLLKVFSWVISISISLASLLLSALELLMA